MNIPVAVKLSPFFTNFAHLAARLDEAGADGLVLFNRFYQPDIDLESLEVSPQHPAQHAHGDAPAAALDRHPARPHRRRASRRPAASTARPMRIKMLMAGADVTMLCSALLRRGIEHISVIEQEMREWMEEHEYESRRSNSKAA